MGSFSLSLTVLVSGGRVLAAAPAGEVGCVTPTAESDVLAARGNVFFALEIGGSIVVLEGPAVAERVSAGVAEYRLAVLADGAGNISDGARITHKVREHVGQAVEKPGQPEQPEPLAGIYIVSGGFNRQACPSVNLSQPGPLSQKPTWWLNFLHTRHLRKLNDIWWRWCSQSQKILPPSSLTVRAYIIHKCFASSDPGPY